MSSMGVAAARGEQRARMESLAERLAINYLKGKVDAYVRDELFDWLMASTAPGSRTVCAAALEMADGLTGGRSRRRHRALRRVRMFAFAATLLLGFMATRVEISTVQWLLAVWGPGHWASIVLAGAVYLAVLMLLPCPAIALGTLAPAAKPHLYRACIAGGLLPLLAYITWLNGVWALVLTVPLALSMLWPLFAEREVRRLAAKLTPRGSA